MDENLEFQYDQLILYLEQYWSFAKRIDVTFFARMFRPVPSKSPRVMEKTHLLSNKIWEGSKYLISENATDEDKNNEFFSILMSDYRMDALCRHLVTHFPGFDFEKLKKVHERQKEKLTILNTAQIFGVVFAIATALLKSVPQSVVEQRIPYAMFEYIVFWITALLLGYLMLFFSPMWIMENKAKKIHRDVGDVLSYITIKQTKGG